eukprot:5270178-Pleurochrysis_carterae.AAC.1
MLVATSAWCAVPAAAFVAGAAQPLTCARVTSSQHLLYLSQFTICCFVAAVASVTVSIVAAG